LKKRTKKLLSIQIRRRAAGNPSCPSPGSFSAVGGYPAHHRAQGDAGIAGDQVALAIARIGGLADGAEPADGAIVQGIDDRLLVGSGLVSVNSPNL